MCKNANHLKKSIELIFTSFDEIKKGEFENEVNEELCLIFEKIGFHNTLLIDILEKLESNKHLQDCECAKSTPFINSDNNYKPYCRWCGNDFKINGTYDEPEVYKVATDKK